uniref:CUB domain-containing protein n=1 Tax=Anisakis simplex TaxID=6269 RepID=A0A158PPB5_ANISI
LNAEQQPKFLYSQGYDSGQYPNSIDCNWILMARSANRRIVLTVHDSRIDDALFSRCDDFCSVRDGATNTSNEIARWCGNSSGFDVISTSNALFVTFHSDDSFQARGFNMSFTDFELPGCPSNWQTITTVNNDADYCYSLRSNHRTWSDAQNDCQLARSNLLTFDSAKEYQSFAGLYSKNASITPWIGYSDAVDEGVFTSVDPSESFWPEDLPNFGNEHTFEDCVYVDWKLKSEAVAYALDDCRDKREYICKRKAEKRSTSRVGSMDANQRLVSGVDANVSPPQPSHHTAVGNVNLVPTTAFTSSLVAHSNDASIRVPNYETNTSFQQGDLSLDKQQQQQQQQMMPSCQIAQQMSFNEDGMMGINALGTDKSITATTTPTTVKMDRWTDTRGANHASTLPTLIGETTATTTRNDNHHYHQHATSRTADDKLMMRIRRNQFFERPRVAVLDNVSAISLDEFWSKNDRPFRSGK